MYIIFLDFYLRFVFQNSQAIVVRNCARFLMKNWQKTSVQLRVNHKEQKKTQLPQMTVLPSQFKLSQKALLCNTYLPLSKQVSTQMQKIATLGQAIGSPPWCRGEPWTCNPRVSSSILGAGNLKKLLIWMKIHGLPQKS